MRYIASVYDNVIDLKSVEATDELDALYQAIEVEHQTDKEKTSLFNSR